MKVRISDIEVRRIDNLINYTDMVKGPRLVRPFIMLAYPKDEPGYIRTVAMADPQMEVAYYWLQWYAPPPGGGKYGEKDPRITRALAGLWLEGKEEETSKFQEVGSWMDLDWLRIGNYAIPMAICDKSLTPKEGCLAIAGLLGGFLWTIIPKPTITDTEFKTLGQVGYEAYCDTTDWKSAVSGAPLPQWRETIAPIRMAWEEAGEAVKTEVLKRINK